MAELPVTHQTHRRPLVAPCTTAIRALVSEVVLDPTEDPVPRHSAVNLTPPFGAFCRTVTTANEGAM